MASPRYDVAVVGAGIVGGACAREIARAGRSVVLLEAGEPGRETSCRAMGHVGVYDDNPAQLALTRLALELWAKEAPRLPPEVEYVRRGSLWIATSEEEMAEVAAKEARFRAHGVEAESIDGARLHELEPNLRADLPGACWVAGDVVLDAAEATHYLLREAVSAGAELRGGAHVRSLGPEGVVLDDGTRVASDRIVLAAGWQAPRLMPQLPIRPRKGHIALIAPRPGFVRHQLSEIGYVRDTEASRDDVISFSFQPRTSGRYLLGATRQYVGESLEVDPRVIERLLARAREFLPEFDRLTVERTWAGLRPAGPDSIPILGRVPARPWLFLAAAHEGIGITTSIATGRIVADLIDGRLPPLDPRPFLPDRLGDSLGTA
ncbi:MAG TPA: FAD-dependent oxidoreductase [Thermoplasmata archaeon]|nr:FAD-dependent oxidoreductase [Thermoplasmata archaeon]